MDRITLEIALVDDRQAVAGILVKNGYRVCTATRKTSGSVKATVLVVDKPDDRRETSE